MYKEWCVYVRGVREWAHVQFVIILSQLVCVLNVVGLYIFIYFQIQTKKNDFHDMYVKAEHEIVPISEPLVRNLFCHMYVSNNKICISPSLLNCIRSSH